MTIIALVIVTVAIWIRYIYRVAELQGDFGGKVTNNEVVFMTFEGLLIIISVTLLSVFHPGGLFSDLRVTTGQGKKAPKTDAIAFEEVNSLEDSKV